MSVRSRRLPRNPTGSQLEGNRSAEMPGAGGSACVAVDGRRADSGPGWACPPARHGVVSSAVEPRFVEPVVVGSIPTRRPMGCGTASGRTRRGAAAQRCWPRGNDQGWCARRGLGANYRCSPGDNICRLPWSAPIRLRGAMDSAPVFYTEGLLVRIQPGAHRLSLFPACRGSCPAARRATWHRRRWKRGI